MQERVLKPTYWFVHALPWPEAGAPIRECAYAVAPPIVPRKMIGSDAAVVLSVADAYHQQTGRRVAFFAEITRWLDSHGKAWGDFRGEDWEKGLAQIEQAHTPGLFLTLSQYHHTVLSASARETFIHSVDRPPHQLTDGDRQQGRDFVQNLLERDWPGYIHQMVAAGKLHFQ